MKAQVFVKQLVDAVLQGERRRALETTKQIGLVEDMNNFRYEINKAGYRGRDGGMNKTPLWIASRYGSQEIVAFLLGYGAEVGKTLHGTGPLTAAAIRNDGDSVSITRLLLDGMDKLNLSGKDMNDARTIATKNGNIELQAMFPPAEPLKPKSFLSGFFSKFPAILSLKKTEWKNPGY